MKVFVLVVVPFDLMILVVYISAKVGDETSRKVRDIISTSVKSCKGRKTLPLNSCSRGRLQEKESKSRLSQTARCK
jgi:hypothetical protein